MSYSKLPARPRRPVEPKRRELSTQEDLYYCSIQELLDWMENRGLDPSKTYLDARIDYDYPQMFLEIYSEESDEELLKRKKKYEKDLIKYEKDIKKYELWMKENKEKIALLEKIQGELVYEE